MSTLDAMCYLTLHCTMMKYSKIKLQRATSNEGLKVNSSLGGLHLVRLVLCFVV
jgi:hypothetical protein